MNVKGKTSNTGYLILGQKDNMWALESDSCLTVFVQMSLRAQMEKKWALIVVTTVKMKEEQKRQRDGSNTSTGFIVQDGALWRSGQPKPETHCHLQTWSKYREGSGWKFCWVEDFPRMELRIARTS
jgi:hypothetical protein